MNPTIKNILAIIAGVMIGSAVNMGIVMASGELIPPPEGADVTTMEGLQASIHLFEPKHFIMPFLAHALGTLAGAVIAGLIAASHKMKFTLAIGIFFLFGGIANVWMLPTPIWFIVLDLLIAYIPMGYLAGVWTKQNKKLISE
ncbi:hypothetical protein N6H18_00735 [Reichenbachiella agarivorans]|uniref:Uncharacterized protein n=1 Tax=Reichenbachiella agarivorans TaxID=2979464 RepID=A0ABY6CPQ3_9BACT|nr:hypothetical protein [Reichenbachiella agarivorans]UXP32501.1 hypothetical protein N6H18_00735 [Reichenbachiella agarivorans]